MLFELIVFFINISHKGEEYQQRFDETLVHIRISFWATFGRQSLHKHGKRLLVLDPKFTHTWRASIGPLRLEFWFYHHRILV